MEFLKAQPIENKSADLPQKSIWDDKNYLDFVKHYSEEDLISPDIKRANWAIFGKSMIYTFLEEKDMPLIEIFSTILRLDNLMSKPAHKINFEEIHKLDQTTLYMFTTAKRAIGSNREKMNERTLQNTQIGQSITTQAMISGAKKGWLRNLF